MICPTCHGNGKLTGRIAGQDHLYPQLPCPECEGSGAAYCCGGAPYDAEADCVGSYHEAVRVIGARVRAGEPVPAFFLSAKRGPVG